MTQARTSYPDRARHAQVVHGLGAQIVRGGLAPGDALETDEHVAVLTPDRPAKLNALTSQMTAVLVERRDPAFRGD